MSLLSYKTVWVLGVYGSLHQLQWLAPLAAFFYVIFYLKQRSFNPTNIAYLITACFIGSLIETFIFQRFVYDYPVTHSLSPFIPLWLISIWFAFPCMCDLSLNHQLKKIKFTLFFGFILCPLPYLGASRLGTIILHNEFTGILILSFTWALIMFSIHLFIKNNTP
ncbi:MAG: DUF2878 family protein [Candidatus Margulisiibacteriota bacterium]